MVCSKALISLVVVGFLASSAFTAPVLLTGNPSEADYEIVATDAANEAGLAEHLDMDKLLLAGDDGNDPADWYYLGLIVNDPDISRTGGPTSFLSRTVLDCLFIGDGGAILHNLSVVLTATDVYVYVDGLMLDSADYDTAVDSGLEIALVKGALPNMAGVDTFDVLAQLDDTGTAADDQLVAFGIPEPATFALLMLGGVLALTRRRR